MEECGLKLDEWCFPSVAYADDIVAPATSQKARERMNVNLTEGNVGGNQL